MVIKIYISSISGDLEVKNRQRAVLQILDSKNIQYEVIDITESENLAQKDFMQDHSTQSGATSTAPNPLHSLPPQIFNGDDYCGDYEKFEMANENNELEAFLKIVSA